MDMIADLLPPDHVELGLKFAAKPALLAHLAQRHAATCGLAPADLLDRLAAREALGSTGIGGGIALPHARIPGLAAPTAHFLRLARPIAWDAVDAQPVDLVVLLLSPPEPQAPHLTALATIARRLRDPQRCASLRSAPDAEAIYTTLIA